MATGLTSGSEISRYRIGERIGAGGMGEVYAAEDPTLGRLLALKILPPEVVTDPVRVRRFIQEAKAASGLQHPHIISIYEIGEARISIRDEVSQTPVHYIAMELVRGATLAEKIRDDRSELRDRVRWLAQVADAVSKAHAAGIIHRDLKPGNVMISDDGYAKVLDFGLAKLTDVVPVGTDETTAPFDKTGEGVMLGTLAYMSPEQVQGKELDARSDIFSFGSMLYEAVTGRRPFKGDGKLELAHAIIHDKPEPVRERSPDCPDELRKLIGRCLQKDRERRYQSMKDVAIELTEMAEEWEGLSINGVSDSGVSVPVVSTRTRWRPAVAGLVLLTVGAMTAVLSWQMLHPETPRESPRFQLAPPPGVDIQVRGATSKLAMSRDGKLVAFTGADRSHPIYLRAIDEVEARLIARGDGPFFSPDGRWMGYFADGRIWKVPVVGGTPLPICEVPQLRGASWGEDGRIVFSAGKGLFVVSADGGIPRLLTEPDWSVRSVRHYWPQILPGGRAALLMIHNSVLEREREIAVVSLETGEVKTLLTNGTWPLYTPNGYLLFSRSGTLFASPFDLQKLELASDPRPVLEGVYYYLGSGFGAFSVSESGALVYVPAPQHSTDPGKAAATLPVLHWVNRSGEMEPAIPEPRAYESASISPDGKRLGLNIEEEHGEARLWLYDLSTMSWSQLSGATFQAPVHWSPDGRWIYTGAIRNGAPNIVRIATDGSGRREWLTRGQDWSYVSSVSPDGTTLLFGQGSAGDSNILTMASSGGDPQPFIATPAWEDSAAFSPDGKWVAYESRETGSLQVHVRPYPEGEPRFNVSTEGGDLALWNPDGTELFFRCGENFCAAPVRTVPVFTAGQPEVLFSLRIPGLDPAFNTSVADVSADGRRFLRAVPRATATPQRMLVYVPNWIHELDRIYNAGGIR